MTEIAIAVADRREIDWEHARRTSSGDDREVIEELRIIAEISNLHTRDRDDDRTPDPLKWGTLTVHDRLGGGSFGEVYRATDARLERDVALKLLRTSRQDETAFVKEGCWLAKVRHQNVVAVYGADDHDGRTGIWMELIHGHTLQQIVERDGPSSARETIGIAIDLCQALAAVHRAGLLHRDIKPQNVMRERGGRIVLMDFGMSREDGHGAEDDSAGTPLFLAPELLDGARATPRSDIFSLGALLFYLVTGERVIAAETVTALRAAHAAGRRRHLREVRPDLPDVFVRIIERALAPNAGDRFASAGEMGAELVDAFGDGSAARRVPRRTAIVAMSAVILTAVLTWLIATRTGVRPPPAVRFDSVAVLPFARLSVDTPEFLAVGLTDAFIGDLARVPQTRVISRTTSIYYARRPQPVAEIARALGVRAVVEGSIKKEDRRMFVQARLVDAHEDRTVWSGERAGTLEEFPRLQHDLAGALLEYLGTPSQPSGHIPSASGYENYLKARAEWNKRTPAGLTAARALFQESVSQSPLFAEAHGGLAATYLLLGAFDVLPKTEMFPRARASVDRALAISDDVSEAHAVLGYILHEQREYEASRREFRRAIALNPSNATARQWYALALLGFLPDEALRQIRIARDLDPLSMPITSDLAVIYRRTGHLREAIEHLTRTTTTFPDFPEAQLQLGWALEAAGRHAEAAAAFRRGVAAGADAPMNIASIGYNLAVSGDQRGAERLVAQLQHVRDTRRVSWTHDATIYAALGDVASALSALERTREEPVIEFQTFVGSIAERQPLAVLWDEPRFVSMVERRVPWLLETERQKSAASQR